MSGAPASIDAARFDRALGRLLGHFALVDRMIADAPRLGAQKRLERELGPELTQRLLSGLSSATA